MVNEKTSPGYLAWLRFRKNVSAIAGMLFILLSVFVSVFCYILSPDTTPGANDQHLELATKKPGFRVKMLHVVKNEKYHPAGFFHRIFFGDEYPYNDIPFIDYRFVDDKIIIREYSEPGDPGEFYREINLADVVYPLAYNKNVVTVNNNLTFYISNGTKKTIHVDLLQKEIKDKHIGEKRFILGTDNLGRDMLSRLLIGTRISLSVGFISVFISLVIGLSLGAIAGYYRGWADNLIQWIINVVWSVPTLLMVIAITLALGRGFWQVFIAVGLTMWVEVARVVRGQVLSLREKEFIEAARALGFRNSRIILRHIIPNVMDQVVVIAAANFASAILMEAGLSFLGIGVQPPTPSWGSMIKDHYGYIIVDKAYLAVIPGLAIMLLVLAFTIVGNGLRDALDVKGKIITS
jgi:peptide/nickel transport system permease protein